MCRHQCSETFSTLSCQKDVAFSLTVWKLPAYSGAFLLTVEIFSCFTYSWSFSAYSCSLFCLQLELFYLQWESASTKGLKGTVSKKKLNCKQKTPTVSKQKFPPFFALQAGRPGKTFLILFGDSELLYMGIAI